MSIRLTQKEALKSVFPRHRVGAVIVKGNRVVSTGYNKHGYSKITRYNTLHAEEMAVVRLLRHADFSALNGSTIYVTRFTPGGNVGLAKPCNRCSELLRSVGVSRVVYSGDNGLVGEMKL